MAQESTGDGGDLGCEEAVSPVTPFVLDEKQFTVQERRAWKISKHIASSVKKAIDSKIRKGELTERQMDQYIAYLNRQTEALLPLLVPSYVWSYVRDITGSMNDMFSLHQSNFIRGIVIASLFDSVVRRFTRDDSERTTLLTCGLLGLGNVLCETPVIGLNSIVDGGDLAAGGLGVVVAYAIHRLHEYKFRIRYLVKGDPL